MKDKEWIEQVVKKTTTCRGMLQLILDNAYIIGGDSYYSDLVWALLDQAQKILEQEKNGRYNKPI